MAGAGRTGHSRDRQRHRSGWRAGCARLGPRWPWPGGAEAGAGGAPGRAAAAPGSRPSAPADRPRVQRQRLRDGRDRHADRWQPGCGRHRGDRSGRADGADSWPAGLPDQTRAHRAGQPGGGQPHRCGETATRARPGADGAGLAARHEADRRALPAIAGGQPPATTQRRSQVLLRCGGGAGAGSSAGRRRDRAGRGGLDPDPAGTTRGAGARRPFHPALPFSGGNHRRRRDRRCRAGPSLAAQAAGRDRPAGGAGAGHTGRVAGTDPGAVGRSAPGEDAPGAGRDAR